MIVSKYKAPAFDIRSSAARRAGDRIMEIYNAPDFAAKIKVLAALSLECVWRRHTYLKLTRSRETDAFMANKTHDA